MKMRVAAFLLCLSTTLSARAEGSRFGFELAFHTQKDLTALGLMLEADIQVAETVVVAAQLPFALGSAEISIFGGSSSPLQSSLGNPSLAALHRSQGEALTYSAGGGLTLPLSSSAETTGNADEFADAVAEAVVLSATAGTYGMRDLWLWMVDYFTLFAPVSLEYRSAGHLLVVADATLAIMLPVRDRADDPSSDSDVALQLRAGVGAHAEAVEGGAALGLVSVPTLDGDVTQLALEPFVKFKFSGGYVDTRLVVNLDKPLGFAFDDGQIWGLQLGAGVLL